MIILNPGKPTGSNLFNRINLDFTGFSRIKDEKSPRNISYVVASKYKTLSLLFMLG